MDAAERTRLVTRYTEEVVTEDELEELLAEESPVGA